MTTPEDNGLIQYRTDYQFREAISINKRLQLIVYRDADFFDMRFDIAHKIEYSNAEFKWQIIASFAFAHEAIQYLSKKQHLMQ